MSSCIAFCFLNYDIIIRYDIWNKFFENIDTSKYVVFIHPKIVKDFSYYYTFPYNIIQNRVITKGKDNITIVSATLQLLKKHIIVTLIYHILFFYHKVVFHYILLLNYIM